MACRCFCRLSVSSRRYLAAQHFTEVDELETRVNRHGRDECRERQELRNGPKGPASIVLDAKPCRLKRNTQSAQLGSLPWRRKAKVSTKKPHVLPVLVEEIRERQRK
ncbi:hypothetical protein BO86DRAFT_108757 [Aspergillus japonicus CBS 114.51]|uniref:Uncharacterized protein n=1 Tax=Aspergillus japonicus CBS 114.51 TaxID=1448312 RepID=A0A8T8XGC4_ASPJA|nr:hypothetical protein BO86DRAFT_108757 [Aspergillus japonicus CBS 114.51]RAH86362.1 hypothetical protein BO86DRAFT_108757 [Aspergillus japonicus CBS 114.51]